MKIRTPKAKGTHPRPAHTIHPRIPGPKLCIHPKRTMFKIDIGIGSRKTQAWHQLPLPQTEHRLEHTRRPSRSLEMADIRFDRTQRDLPFRQSKGGK